MLSLAGLADTVDNLSASLVDCRAVTQHPLVTYRQRHALTQGQLAKRVGVALNTVWRWEHGYRQPRSHALKRLSAITQIPAEEFVAFALREAA